MIAILLTEENVARRIGPFLEELKAQKINLNHFIDHNGRWYVVSDYARNYHDHQDWAILPHYILERNFDYDHENIDIEWTRLVRK